MSVEQLAADLGRVVAVLPFDTLAEVDRQLGEAQTILAACTEGSQSPEVPEAIGGYTQAKQAVGHAYQVCEHVRQSLERYLCALGMGGGTGAAIPTPVTPPTPSDDVPQPTRAWQTVAAEHGAPRSFPSYTAAKRALGSRQGQELHHIVEQCQAKPERSAFEVDRVNTTDNFVWLPVAAHRRISKRYSTKVPGVGKSLRDVLNGVSWERQYARGVREVNRAWKETEQDESAG